MKSKILIIAFIAILLVSAFNMMATMAQCPTCNGTGKVICPDCDGTGKLVTEDEGTPCEACSGNGTLPPNLIATVKSSQVSGKEIYLETLVQNNEDVEAYGKVKVEVGTGSAIYEGISNRTSFPPQEETAVPVRIEGISDAHYSLIIETLSLGENTTIDRLRSPPRVSMYEVDNIVCPYCDGTGIGSITRDCPRCDGTGFIDCPTCGGSGVATEEQNGALDIGGAVYGAAAVAVVAGVAIATFVVVKKRGVKEEDLKKLPPAEFQNWVLKKIGGKSSSQSDARMGIDGYTIEGQPISIKQADNVGRNAFENFAAAMGRRNAKNGTIIAFSFGTDAIRGRVRAKLSYGLEIEMVTVKELIESRRRTL
jgi:hypothetical protein